MREVAMTHPAPRLLQVDLRTGAIARRQLPAAWAAAFIGLRGLGTRLLMELKAWQVDPFSPDNPLIFASGPLTGTAVPTGGRHGVLTRSPLTGTAACSNSGGHVGAALRFAGHDVLLIKGQAPRPVYLFIDDGRAELHAADDLWGLSFWEAEERLKARHGHDVRVAGIGVAGERRVRFAAIMNDHDRAAGRSGVGAVMGAKNLKAIVVRGTGGVPLAEPQRFDALARVLTEKLMAMPSMRNLGHDGTQAMMRITCSFGALPTRNATDTTFEACEDISAEAMQRPRAPDGRPNLVGRKACFACPVGCGRIAQLHRDHFTWKHGAQYHTPHGGLEYEAAYALGAMVGVGDLDACTFAFMVCNEQGMDPISFGATLACAMELFELGVIGEDETGRPLRFGDARALAEMALATARREGFGDVLAEGAARLAARCGRPELAMQVKGQEFPGYDPRAMQGMGLAYATSPRGACHLRASPYASDFETADPEVKPRIVRNTQDRKAAIDSLGICSFITPQASMAELAELLSAAVGEEWTKQRLTEAGERIFNLERLFNLRAGFSVADDTLPARMLEEPAPSGVHRGEMCRLDVMLPAYYALRGWDADGKPLSETLSRLGLADLS